MELERSEVLYEALKARDARLDGRVFVGVASTGIYCRPVCPARTPKPEHCRFFPSAAAAQGAGFRPCLRCRPETAPEQAAWQGTSNTVARGLALIAEGVMDGEGVEGLAERLGMGARQVRRLFERHLGASPVEVAQTRRVLFAKQLLQETRMPASEVAFAAGFGSVRRFNEAFEALFEASPLSLRRGRAAAEANAPVRIELKYRPPYDWAAMLAHLAARAVEGIEWVEGGRYGRKIAVEGGVGRVEVRHLEARSALEATIVMPGFAALRGLAALVARLRRLFDLDADVALIGERLGGDELLGPMVRGRPGLRVAGAWSGFELAVRAVLGQQVTVAAARGLASKLVGLCGGETFPTAAQVAAADLSGLGMPGKRRAALLALAEAAAAAPEMLEPRGATAAALERLRSIAGIGAWTAEYVALRAMREPDAFPASDVVLLRAAGMASAAELERRSERWRPWRAYAAQHLWTSEASDE